MPDEIEANGGKSKAPKRKSTRDSDLWYKRYPARFRRDTMHDHPMPFDLRCQWSLLTDLFYEHGGPLLNDDRWVALQFGCDVRKWKHIRAQLFAHGKLTIGPDGLIHNKTADEVIGERADKLVKTAVAPARRRLGKGATPASTPATTSVGSPPGSPPGTGADLSEKPNDINEGAQKTAGDTRASLDLPSEERREIERREIQTRPFSSVAAREEKDDERRVVFENGKIELFNGMRAYWLDRFDGDGDRLELGLIQAAAFVQSNSSRPIEAQVSAQLARQCAERHDRDKRYAAAADRKAATNPASGTDPLMSPKRARALAAYQEMFG
jgi:hypothetical protein